MRHEHKAKVNPRARSLLEARAHDPFGVLGMHRHGNHYIVGIFEPHAERAWVRDGHEWREMQPEGDGLNGGGVSAEPIAWMSRPYSGPATLPPLAGSLLAPESHGL